MGRHARQASQAGAEQEQQQRQRVLKRALHQSIFAHLTRPVADPDRPGQWISFDELDQRLRGRAYRQAVHADRKHPEP